MTIICNGPQLQCRGESSFPEIPLHLHFRKTQFPSPFAVTPADTNHAEYVRDLLQALRIYTQHVPVSQTNKSLDSRVTL